MSDATIIGLGLMGSALARVLMLAGHSVCVWNRSTDRAQPLVELGAFQAATLSEALAASPVVIVCIDNYASTTALFDDAEAKAALRGRILVQLTTGTPKDARDAEIWAESLGVRYLDGAILCGPNAIGTPAATLAFSGNRAVFDDTEALLRALAPVPRFAGARVGSASALDLAWLAQLYGTYVAAAHGVILCESEGVDLADYLAVLNPTGAAHWLVGAIRDEAYENPTARLSVWNAALRRVQEQARTADINSEMPDLVAHVLDRAEAAGLGDQHIAAMVKVMRPSPR